MTIYTEDYVTREAARVIRMITPATAFFFSNLARLVDLTQLREGDADYDFLVRVPLERLHELDLQIADLTIEVQKRFGVKINIMPIG